MLNQVVLVGRLTKNPEVKTLDSGKKVSNVTLAIPRTFKNNNGVYDTDFIKCTLWDNMALNTKEYCKQGSILGVKGRLETTVKDDKFYSDVIAEKVTFLSGSKE